MNRISIVCIAAAIFLAGPTTAGGRPPLQQPEGPHCRLGASGLDGYCAIFYGYDQCSFVYEPTDCPVGKHVKTMKSIYCPSYGHGGYVPIAPRRPCQGAH